MTNKSWLAVYLGTIKTECVIDSDGSLDLFCANRPTEKQPSQIKSILTEEGRRDAASSEGISQRKKNGCSPMIQQEYFALGETAGDSFTQCSCGGGV